MKELKEEIINELKTGVKKPEGGNKTNNVTNDRSRNKTAKYCTICNKEKTLDHFYNTSTICKECNSERVSCSIYSIALNTSSLKKHERTVHSKKLNIYIKFKCSFFFLQF